MFLMLIVGINIYAASLTGSSNVYVGDTVTVTFNFGQNVGAYDNLTVSYDTNMLEYVSGDSLKEDVWWDSSEASNGISTKTYTFRAKNAGTSRVVVVVNGVTSADANMTSLGTVTAEKMINISQKNENKTEDKPNKTENTNGNVNSGSKTASGNNYLKYLQISEEGLTPNFTRNVTDYAISVGENVTSIDVLAKAEDANEKIESLANDLSLQQKKNQTLGKEYDAALEPVDKAKEELQALLPRHYFLQAFHSLAELPQQDEIRFPLREVRTEISAQRSVKSDPLPVQAMIVQHLFRSHRRLPPFGISARSMRSDQPA